MKWKTKRSCRSSQARTLGCVPADEMIERMSETPGHDVLARLDGAGARGIGQSSWGPTGFAFAPFLEEAERLAKLAMEHARRGAWVEVRLQNDAAKGMTHKDVELAKKIEDVVHWQPESGGALEGTRKKISDFA